MAEIIILLLFRSLLQIVAQQLLYMPKHLLRVCMCK